MGKNVVIENKYPLLKDPTLKMGQLCRFSNMRIPLSFHRNKLHFKIFILGRFHWNNDMNNINCIDINALSLQFCSISTVWFIDDDWILLLTDSDVIAVSMKNREIWFFRPLRNGVCIEMTKWHLSGAIGYPE